MKRDAFAVRSAGSLAAGRKNGRAYLGTIRRTVGRGERRAAAGIFGTQVSIRIWETHSWEKEIITVQPRPDRH